MPQAQSAKTKRCRLLIPEYVWDWLYIRSQNHDRKPGAEILQILKAELARDSEGNKEAAI